MKTFVVEASRFRSRKFAGNVEISIDVVVIGLNHIGGTEVRKTMEKKSRYELIKTIESQKEQLIRFETRLRGELADLYSMLICATDLRAELCHECRILLGSTLLIPWGQRHSFLSYGCRNDGNCLGRIYIVQPSVCMGTILVLMLLQKVIMCL